MVNILTSSKAAAKFEMLDDAAASGNRREGCPSAVYNYGGEVMKKELSKASSRSSHTKAASVLGHIVKPGYISFYTINGKVFAVSEGRWWLVKVSNTSTLYKTGILQYYLLMTLSYILILIQDPIKAQWLQRSRNISLDQNHITAGDVHILRILPGEVGMIRAQGTEVLLDVGTHVFNSGTVSIVGKVSYADNKYFRHGRYHYLRVERGYLAKVWTVVKQNEVDTVVSRVSIGF